MPPTLIQPMSRTQFPRLSLAERDRRWLAVRNAMRVEGIDCLLVHGDAGRWDQKFTNMRYLSHIGGNGEDGWMVFPLEGPPVVFLFSGGATLNGWRQTQDWVTDLHNGAGRLWSHFLVQTLRERGLASARIGIVGLSTGQEPEGTAPHTTMMRLMAGLPQAEVIDATALVERQQLYRSSEEIAFIEAATRIGDHGVEVLRASCRPGVNEYDAYARTFAALLEAGSEQPLMLFWDSGQTVNHAQRYPGRNILNAGDMIITEISPRYFGYWSHFQAMVGIGQPTRQYMELFEIVLASYNSALDAFRPGVTLRDVWEAFDRPIRQAGAYSMHVHAHGTGGRGTDVPLLSAPSRLKDLNPEARATFERTLDIEVREGMVLAFEPHATRDGVHGVHMGDPVVVTGNGCRRLSALDLRDWVVPLD